MAEVRESSIVIQRNLKELDEWINRNLVKFNKENVKLCSLEHQLASVQVGNRQVRASVSEKEPRVLLNFSQQNGLTSIKPNCLLT